MNVLLLEDSSLTVCEPTGVAVYAPDPPMSIVKIAIS
jgi:hypothetical protein